jgi:predicted dinucleotide-binding enzyme
MRIGVLGTGVVGRTIAARLAGLGHDIVIGTRDPAATRERTEMDRFGTASATWLAEHPELDLGTFAEATAHGELVVNATSGLASLDVLATAGAANLEGKVLIDVANVLDFSRELMLPIWLSLMGALNLPPSSFQFKVVR